MASDTPRTEAEELLQRIESALQRAENAAGRIDTRQQSLFQAAQDTLSGLDRLIAAEEGKPNG